MKAVICVLAALLVASVAAKGVQGNTKCDVCKFIVNGIEGWIMENKTETEIFDHVLMLCKYADQYSGVCDMAVQMGEQKFVEYIKSMTPDQVCTQLKECTSVKAPKDNIGCTICQVVIQEVEKNYVNNETEDQLKADIMQECQKLGGIASDICDVFLFQELDNIYKYVNQQEGPEQVCAQINVCSNMVAKQHKAHEAMKHFSHKLLAEFFRKYNKKIGANDLECSGCQLLVAQVESMLLKNQTMDEIAAEIKQICSYLGDDYQGICDSVVNDLLGLIVDLIQEGDADPKVICQKVGVCPSSFSHAQMGHRHLKL